MATVALERPETALRPGYNGFLDFAELIGLPIEPYMRRISRAYFSRAREVVAVLPRGRWTPGRVISARERHRVGALQATLGFKRKAALRAGSRW